MDLGKLGVWYFLDGLSAPQAAATAQRIEKIGYKTLWIPETVGKHPFVTASWLLANTKTLNLATGIAQHRVAGGNPLGGFHETIVVHINPRHAVGLQTVQVLFDGAGECGFLNPISS